MYLSQFPKQSSRCFEIIENTSVPHFRRLFLVSLDAIEYAKTTSQDYSTVSSTRKT